MNLSRLSVYTNVFHALIWLNCKRQLVYRSIVLSKEPAREWSPRVVADSIQHPQSRLSTKSRGHFWFCLQAPEYLTDRKAFPNRALREQGVLLLHRSAYTTSVTDHIILNYCRKQWRGTFVNKRAAEPMFIASVGSKWSVIGEKVAKLNSRLVGFVEDKDPLHSVYMKSRKCIFINRLIWLNAISST